MTATMALPRVSEAGPKLPERPLLDLGAAGRAAEVFKVLACDTRLRLLHALALSGQARVGELAAALGMAPQAVSNQLQRLADRGIVAGRRQGTSVFYRIDDPCAARLLEYALCLLDGTCAGEG